MLHLLTFINKLIYVPTKNRRGFVWSVTTTGLWHLPQLQQQANSDSKCSFPGKRPAQKDN